jgi:hypothetical protein
MELKMPAITPKQEHELGQRGRTPALPDPDPNLDASVAHTDRERATSNASQSSDHAGLVAVLWLLALLIAEIGFWMLAFAHMYRT